MSITPSCFCGRVALHARSGECSFSVSPTVRETSGFYSLLGRYDDATSFPTEIPQSFADNKKRLKELSFGSKVHKRESQWPIPGGVAPLDWSITFGVDDCPLASIQVTSKFDSPERLQHPHFYKHRKSGS